MLKNNNCQTTFFEQGDTSFSCAVNQIELSPRKSPDLVQRRLACHLSMGFRAHHHSFALSSPADSCDYPSYTLIPARQTLVLFAKAEMKFPACKKVMEICDHSLGAIKAPTED